MRWELDLGISIAVRGAKVETDGDGWWLRDDQRKWMMLYPALLRWRSQATPWPT